jgi:16S rRNA (guanine(966)-N(2))-methyltransferase RsmD
MRVIGGEFRSRKLKAAAGLETRPTPDRLRESLFNILAPGLADALFIDAYAGTGAVGIEALSRGARRAIFIEKSRVAVDVLRRNVASLGLDARSEVFVGNVRHVLERMGGDILFADPPYEQDKAYAEVLELAKVPLVILQHASRIQLPDAKGEFSKVRVVKQGDNSLSFYSASKIERG